MKKKISEKRIVDVLAAHMKKTHTVGIEVKHYEKRIDLVAIDKDGEQIITVEAKLENWKKAIGQAMVNLVAGQKAYVGMYNKNAHRVDISILDEYGIGLISIGLKWGEVEFLHEAQPSKYFNPIAGDRVKQLVLKKDKHPFNKFENDLKRWKAKYKCSLGGASGWCDGANSKRCPSYLKNDKESGGCELPL